MEVCYKSETTRMIPTHLQAVVSKYRQTGAKLINGYFKKYLFLLNMLYKIVRF